MALKKKPVGGLFDCPLPKIKRKPFLDALNARTWKDELATLKKKIAEKAKKKVAAPAKV